MLFYYDFFCSNGPWFLDDKLFIHIQVFMQTSFALEDPEIFNNVLPWSMVTQETKDGVKDVPRNSAKLLQEKVTI